MKRSPYTFPAIVLTLALAAPLAACGGQHATASHEDGASAPSGSRVGGVTYDGHGDPVGVHRYIRWSEKIGQGGQPMGEEAFRNLEALGFRTILSVDGAMPEVELAARYGLRYVHVPIGYDGVPPEAALQIVKTGQIDGPIFVHCHHGKHRGPCAAMLLRMVYDGVSADEAIKGLERSKTNPNYTGLWKTVREFQAPTAEALAAVGPLPSKVTPEGLQAAMVDTSLRWEHLQLAKDAGWKTPADHPDIAPAHEARMLWELFREMARNTKECRDHGDVFLKLLKDSELATIELEKALRADDRVAAKKHYATVKGLCKECHAQFRD